MHHPAFELRGTRRRAGSHLARSGRTVTGPSDAEAGPSSPPRVSVVVPCLNRAHFLSPTIASILSQDYPRVECIVVDGGSTDGTVEILREYGDAIRWVSEPDNGHADAINKGWAMSAGDVLAWLNADDLWEVPTAVSEAVQFLSSNRDVDVVYGDCGRIDLEGRLIGWSYLHGWDLEYAVEHCDHCIPQPAAFMRRRIIDRVGGLDSAFYQKKDHDLWLRIALAGGVIRYLPRVLAHARSQRGLSFDARTSAPACPQVARSALASANLPPDLADRGRGALSNAYLRGAEYAAAGGGAWGLAARYAATAIRIDPTNARRSVTRLLAMTRRHADGSLDRRAMRAVLEGARLPFVAWRRMRALLGRIAGPGPRPRNLSGDRDVEWSFVAARIGRGPGRALDFGWGGSPLAMTAHAAGFDVLAVDLRWFELPLASPKLRFALLDLLRTPLPESWFDLVINCSSVEHAGLVGRYGVCSDDVDGDLKAMCLLRSSMHPGGRMLLTVPVGVDAVFRPMTRVYGEDRLPRLLEGFTVIEEQFWAKNAVNVWVERPRSRVLNEPVQAGDPSPQRNYYGLGCFVLERPVEPAE